VSTLDDLLNAARAVQAKAYAPYSRFKVGAAIRTLGGQVFVGCNVENASYPEGACAETGAISAMIAAGEARIAEMVVVGEGDALVTPCGGCRQRIREFASGDTPVHIAGLEGVRRSFRLDELLPFSFGPDNLSS
jgi:cytidine deaminase